MKNKRKKLTNKEIEHRTNVLMSEIEKLHNAIDNVYLTLIYYIELNDDSDRFKKHIESKMEKKDVQHKLQESSS